MKLATIFFMITFSLGGFIAGQQYKLMSMFADGIISVAEHKAIMTKEIAKTKARVKTKERIKRILVAIPVIGVLIAAYFEKKDFEEWQEKNPNGKFKQYSCEVGTLSTEYLDEVLQDLPQELFKNIPETALSKIIPECKLAS